MAETSNLRHRLPPVCPQQSIRPRRSRQLDVASQLVSQSSAICLSLVLSLSIPLPGCGISADSPSSGTSSSGTSSTDQQQPAGSQETHAGGTVPRRQPQPASLDHIPAVSADEIHLTIEAESPARYHRVSRGESLSGIARQNRTSVEVLQRLNGLDDPGFLEPGQLLRLP